MLSQLPFNASVLSVALLGAIAYGSGDFLGGRASLRRTDGARDSVEITPPTSGPGG